mmetsp:Transcript_12861/g.31356  ORF Transcript_12861/g.31356 Transcript_12861/m.31356 type:complete len:316 (+) Transcript_12861:360-1307(+)
MTNNMSSSSRVKATRSRSATAAVIVAMIATRSTSMLAVSAFTAGRFSSTSVNDVIRTKAKMSALFAQSSLSESEDERHQTIIETITDTNSHTLLHPSTNPARPVLVDAFAPCCGPCKLLDNVLHEAQPRYANKVDFVRWNVNDKENTVGLKNLLLDGGYTLTKLPSLIVFREGKPVAVRTGFANDIKLDYFLEETLPDVLERTFDDEGVKFFPMDMVDVLEEERKLESSKRKSPRDIEKEKDALVEAMKALMSSPSKSVSDKAIKDEVNEHCFEDPTDCIESIENVLIENRIWENRTVVPAMDGILLPERSSAMP